MNSTAAPTTVKGQTVELKSDRPYGIDRVLPAGSRGVVKAVGHSPLVVVRFGTVTLTVAYTALRKVAA